ncbi:MAG: nitrate reductase, partial [Verrucomicrobia bacterium]|nr:nitrate reductase [Verrucomicrobiota bacterium]
MKLDATCQTASSPPDNVPSAVAPQPARLGTELSDLWSLRRWTGHMTEELLLEPGRFGLGHVSARKAPEAIASTVCGYCSTGCSLDAHIRDGQAVNLTPTTTYPVNIGMACPKGWEALAPLDASDRLLHPMARGADGRLARVSWEDALHLFRMKFSRTMEQHGPESVAFLSTGQIATEEMAMLGALWKFGMGAVHCDSNTRQCMATSHVAYKQSFGFDSPPFTYADFEESDVLVFIGSNLCIAHPIMWQRVLANRRQPRIIVIDPRRTETAAAATEHLAIAPKSDLVLLYGLANIVIQAGWVDSAFVSAHTEGYEAFADFVRQFSPEQVANAAGISITQLYRLAEAIRPGRRVSFWWTMGVNQSHEATRTAQAIINLALIGGHIGKAGTGANSITGQCNAMGSRLFANITSLFGGRSFQSPSDRADVAALLNVPESRIPQTSSLPYDQILERVGDGRIKALWVIATNSIHSWGQRCQTEAILGKLDFLVVQDLYGTTETAKHADLLLPAAGWGEKDGTLINSERRIGRIRKVKRAPGEALSDFNIFKLVAQVWGCGDLLNEWSSPEAVFQILKRLSRNRPCDITGIRDYDHIDQAGGIQWPWSGRDQEPDRERRLFSDGHFFHPNRKAR